MRLRTRQLLIAVACGLLMAIAIAAPALATYHDM